MEDIWVMMTSSNGSFNDTEKEIFREKFIDFQRLIVHAVKTDSWDGNDGVNRTSLQWSYPGALLYAVTVITTIGK